MAHESEGEAWRRMISKEIFVKVLQLIQEQHKINDRLKKHSASWDARYAFRWEDILPGCFFYSNSKGPGSILLRKTSTRKPLTTVPKYVSGGHPKRGALCFTNLLLWEKRKNGKNKNCLLCGGTDLYINMSDETGYITVLRFYREIVILVCDLSRSILQYFDVYSCILMLF